MQIANSQDFAQQNQQKMDEQLLVRFFLKPRQDPTASAEEGRPVFKDVVYVEIRVPGSRDAVCRPAGAGDIARFQRHYDAFQSRTADVVEGTPLAEWPQMSRSQVEELSFYNVKTVEQLIAMSDQNASQFMGLNTLKAKAKAWLDLTNEYKAAEELQAELSKRDSEIAELKAAVDELKATTRKPAVRKKVGKKKVAKKKE